jgi:hypothetical protein
MLRASNGAAGNKDVDDLTFYESLANRWDSLTQTNLDSQGIGRLSLNRAKKGVGLYLIHEHQGEEFFKEFPGMVEFKK